MEELLTGALESTELDFELAEDCFANSVSLSDFEKNRDDSTKVLSWDSSLEFWLNHRSNLIGYEGRNSGKWLPWNLYQPLNLGWLDGLYLQQRSSDCTSFAHRNSLNFSRLVSAWLSPQVGPPAEVAHSMTYAIARGGGKANFGGGLSLVKMMSWSSKIGNFLTKDFGRYDVGAYCRKYKEGSIQSKNAFKNQSIVIPLRDADFEKCFLITSAGVGICVATSIYPSAGSVGGSGLAEPSRWASGGHAMALVAAIENDGKRYIYLANSHGAKYPKDKFYEGKQFGVWLSEENFNRLLKGAHSRKRKFIYGNWYGNLSEV